MTKLAYFDNQYSDYSGTTPYWISAGGVVYRRSIKGFEFLLLGRTEENATSYHLPKGTLHIDESLESCAVREIAEEAGVEIVLRAYIGSKNSDFMYKNMIHHDKTIHYYAAEYQRDTEQMDSEHEFKEWFSYDDAITNLSSNVKCEQVFVERCMEFINGFVD